MRTVVGGAWRVPYCVVVAMYGACLGVARWDGHAGCCGLGGVWRVVCAYGVVCRVMREYWRMVGVTCTVGGVCGGGGGL